MLQVVLLLLLSSSTTPELAKCQQPLLARFPKQKDSNCEQLSSRREPKKDGEGGAEWILSRVWSGPFRPPPSQSEGGSGSKCFLFGSGGPHYREGRQHWEENSLVRKGSRRGFLGHTENCPEPYVITHPPTPVSTHRTTNRSQTKQSKRMKTCSPFASLFQLLAVSSSPTQDLPIGDAFNQRPALLAQSVERETLNLKVAGSTPA
ncbi:hypothetical protein LX32DRAFT_280405 [Colletotrichum zoysiae]|uniref:Secreted protein n=1 Tax=Colletotrichum zoysiae TaxID=1216348 RepID=A0AAD9M4A0_9PEZI|nr:hypothetical protein LX32DRAFT_280405 [Colletotrichum zoysiae]